MNAARGKTGRKRRVFLVAGEDSGDQLGGRLMAAIRRRAKDQVAFTGVGGEAMAKEGCRSLFPLDEVAVMGPMAIFRRLPSLVRRVYQTVSAAVEADPDVLVILDSPEFTHPIARRVRRRMPHLPIVDYVSPSVWAWRPGRAQRMRGYIDHVLAILPFEPDAHARLGGPECSYVGHPLIERLDWIRGVEPQELAGRLGIGQGEAVLTVLPGSRVTEVSRLMEPFGATLALLLERHGPLQVIVPVTPGMREAVEQGASSWPVRPHLVESETEKFQAFQRSRAALAASGTVTLELGLSGTPMVVAYRVEPLVAPLLRRTITAPSTVLPNLILGENAFPELHQEHCTPERMAEALLPLLRDSPERTRQLEALSGLDGKMRLPNRGRPSDRAARIVLDHAGRRKPA